MLESTLKKVEVTISDQGMIAATKSGHYEEKFKAMTQKHQAALNKAVIEAQAHLDAGHAQHERDMISYREGLKSSVVTSLLQARLKMAHEAKTLGFDCPSWDVDAWETKLRSLGGNPVKPAAEGSSKAVGKPTGASGEAERDIQADPETDAVENAMNEEGAAS
ncbi:hypothetical protein Hdeb2414_s0027g00691651 [Helianthus debilis subsp. tardiflorus]